MSGIRGMDGFDGQVPAEPGVVYGLRGWDLSAGVGPSWLHGMFGHDWADGVNTASCLMGRQPPCPPPPPGSEAELLRLCDLARRLRVRHGVLAGAEHLACGPAEEVHLVAQRQRLAQALAIVQTRIAVTSGNCGCGFWAYWADACTDPLAGLIRPPGRQAVYGVIEGSGMVQFGELGFRCERARIVALCPGLIRGDLERAAPLYPSAMVFGGLAAMLGEFPASAAQALPEGERGCA